MPTTPAPDAPTPETTIAELLEQAGIQWTTATPQIDDPLPPVAPARGDIAPGERWQDL